jgi:3-methylcrotonyl-CoA carboxylase alpha subunit
MARRIVLLRDGEHLHRVAIDDGGALIVDGESMTVAAQSGGLFRVGTDPVRTAWSAVTGRTCWVFIDGEVRTFEIEREETRRKGAARHHGTLMAPMPGTVVRVDTEVGAKVTRGATLVILEAMKMELPVRATSDGVVTAVNCRVGELVQPGKSLIEIE